MLVPKFYIGLLIILLLTNMPNTAYPLSLGELSVNSAPDRPLQAEVEMLSVNPDYPIESYKAHLASPTIYKYLKLQRPAELTQLKINSIYRDGKPVIQLSSDAPLPLKTIDLVIEVNSPGDSVLKQFRKVALDAKNIQYAHNASQATVPTLQQKPEKFIRSNQQYTAIKTTQPQKTKSYQPVIASHTPSVDTHTKQKKQQPVQQQHYVVEKGDTLFKIAARLRYSDITAEQMMLALYQENKQQFQQGTPDQLKVGDKLRLPTLRSVKLISPRQALAFKKDVVQTYRKNQQLKAQTEQTLVAQVGKTEEEEKTAANQPEKDAVTNTSGSQTIVQDQPLQLAGAKGNKGMAITGLMHSRLQLLENQLFAVNNNLKKEQASNDGLRKLLRSKNRLIWQRDDMLRECKSQQQAAAPIQTSSNEPPASQAYSSQTNTQNSVQQPEKQAPGQVLAAKNQSSYLAEVKSWLLLAILLSGLGWLMTKARRKKRKQAQLTEAVAETSDKPVENPVAEYPHLVKFAENTTPKTVHTVITNSGDINKHMAGLRHSLSALQQNIQTLSALQSELSTGR